MWVEVKQRLIAILQTLPRIGETNVTIAESVPQTRQDFHGYLIVVKPSRDTVQAVTVSESRTHVLNFAVECTSPQVNTGLIVENEYRIEAYADAITALLERYPRLEDLETRVGLTGVQATFVSGAQFQSPSPYVDGGPQHYKVTVTIQVTFDRATGC